MVEPILIPTEQACNDFNISRKPRRPNRENNFLMGEQYSQNPWFSKFMSQTPEDTNVNEIILAFKKNTPFEVSREGSDLIRSKFSPSGGSGQQEPFLKAQIIPNFDHESGLEITHNHKWDTATDMFSGLMKKAVGFVADVNNFITKMDQIQNPNQTATSIRHDIAEQYVSTDKQRITIPFTLFTKKDFVRDILTPLMVLTSLSYPKRTDEEVDVKQLNNNAQSAQQNQNNSILNSVGGGIQQGTSNLANDLIPGYRVFTIENPPLVDIYHSGKLFKYINCYISNISYNFLGPWINADVVTDPNAEGAFKNIYQEMSGWKKTVPTRADCTIELATTEPHFADDYVAILKEAKKDSGGGSGPSDGLVKVLSR